MVDRRLAVTAVFSCCVGFIAAKWPSQDQAASPPSEQSAPDQNADPSPVPTSGPLATGSASAPSELLPLLERARAGDRAALKQLELSTQDSDPEAAVALYEGHSLLAEQDALRLVDDLGARPETFEDKARMLRLYELLLDATIAPKAMLALSKLPQPRVYDVLHDLCSRGEPGARLTLLACQLEQAPEVSRSRSPTVGLTLAIAQLKTCSAMRQHLETHRKQLDARTLPAIDALLLQASCKGVSHEPCGTCPAGTEVFLRELRVELEARPFEVPWRKKDKPAK